MKRRSDSFGAKQGAKPLRTASKLGDVLELAEPSTTTRPTTLNIDLSSNGGDAESDNGDDDEGGGGDQPRPVLFTQIRDTKPPEMKYSREM